MSAVTPASPYEERSLDNASPAEELQNNSFWTQFTQQRLKAWQPILEPKWVITFYIVCGVFFIGIGVLLLLASWSVVEHVVDYTDSPQIVTETGVGWFEISIGKDMEPPIWVYYQLEGFHQNHRRYVKSRDNDQMRGIDTPKTHENDVPSCEPWTATYNRVNYPCGLVARSVFNDTYEIIQMKAGSNEWTRLKVQSDAKTIAWPADVDTGKFKNVDPEGVTEGVQNQIALNMWVLQRFPPVRCRQKIVDPETPYVPVFPAKRDESTATTPGGAAESVKVTDCRSYTSSPTCHWTQASTGVGPPFTCSGNYEEEVVADWGIENGHFIVWMRIAGLPSFRKLWGKVDEPLKKGSKLRIYYNHNFNVREFEGKKAFVMSTSSVLGGRNDFLGYGYMVVGVCCLLFGLVFLVKNLRPMGDVSRLPLLN